jgi:arginine-tRNA-protein transferase
MHYTTAICEHECGYIAGQNAKSEYIFNVSSDISKTMASLLLVHGWRRFGERFFRPVCNGCHKCESIRILAYEFEPSRSMRRTIKKNANTKIKLEHPSVTQEKIDLYNRFHAHRTKHKGWEENIINWQRYTETFVDGNYDFALEANYYIDDKLVGIDYIDVLPSGLSSIYFIYDLDYAQYSLGVYSLLMQFEWAKKMGLKYVYLGWAVKENASLLYKFDYKPNEILQNRPTIDENAIWI